MYKILKQCKSFAELYGAIEQRGCVKIAEGLLVLLCISPLLGGVIDIFMLLSPGYYDAYRYNDLYASLMHMIFNLVLSFYIMYMIGKMKYMKTSIKNMIIKIRNEQSWFLFWLALLIWSLISTVLSVNVKSAVFGGTILYSGFISHFYALAILGCAGMIENPQSKIKLIQIIIIDSDIMSVLMLCSEYDVPFLRKLTPFTGLGFFTNSNHLGYFLAMSVMCMAGMYFVSLDSMKDTGELSNKVKKNMMFYISSYIVNIYALIINDTLGAYIAIVISLILLMFIWWKREKNNGYNFDVKLWMPITVIVIITGISAAGLLETKLNSTIGESLVALIADILKITHKSEGYRNAGSGRWGLWLDAVKCIKQRPILGYGPDVLVDRFGNVLMTDVPHNEYIECAYYLGIPGLVMYLGGLVGLYISKMKNKAKLSTEVTISMIALLSYLISAFFGVRKFYTAPFMYMFMGLIIKDNIAKLKKN